MKLGSSSGAPPLALCGRHPAAIAAPRELPSSYPIPKNAVLTAVHRVRGVVVVQGLQPLGIKDAGRFIIRDVGSRNGVAIAVRGERRIEPGQRVLAGDVMLRVESV